MFINDISHRIQLLTHGVHRGCGDGGAVPDHHLDTGVRRGGLQRSYRHGGIVQAQGVRVGAAQAGAVVSDEPPGQKPDNKCCR